MFSARKLGQPLIPRIVLFSLCADSVVITHIVRNNAHVSSGCWPVSKSINPSFLDLKVQAVARRISNGSNNPLRTFSTMTGTVLVQARDPAKLSMEIENAIDETRLSDACKLFDQLMEMEGFPRKSAVNKVFVKFAESMDVHLLEKAFGMVEQAIAESKHTLLEKEPLIYLSCGLAKCGLPVQASTIVRRLIEMQKYPPVTAWSTILAYMSLTSHGAFLAAELILEIGYLFQDGRVDPRKKINAPLIGMKPNIVAVNIALAGCLMFGTTRKAEQLLDMMPRIGVKVDATLLIIMAHIYEKNGRRDELRKLQRYIDEAHNLTDIRFRQFYNCLLSCHLKFGDLDSASNMVLKMLRKAKEARNSLASAIFLYPGGNKWVSSQGSSENLKDTKSEDLEENISSKDSLISYADFLKDRDFSEFDAKAKKILDALVLKVQNKVELVTTEYGILQPTEKVYVKLVKAFLEAGKTNELAAFLVKVEKEDSPSSSDDSPLVNVINTCISLGWLDHAHDLLDEMRLAGVRTTSSVYASLLKAYCKENRRGEITCLLRDAQRAGIQLDSSCYEDLIESKVFQNDTEGALRLFKEMKAAKIPRSGHKDFEMLVKGCEDGGEAGLMAKLLHEIKEGQKVDSGVHDWNNVIHFFCKKRLMQDAEKALKKMISLGYAPNAQTYHSMVTGYAAVGGKYVEVTELWGEMKALASSTGMTFDQELLDAVLYTFVRGGFFVRANEVVGMMEKGDMFVDKYKYRTLFFKYHKTLFKGKPPKFQSESQVKKRDAALKFKAWVGLG